MADVIVLKSAPAAPPADQKLPEAKVVTQNGAETRITVDTTQTPPKADEKKPDAKPAEPKPDEKPADPKPPEVPPKATPESAKDAVTKAGLDMGKLSAEYVANGNKLSDESLASLEKSGITKAQVDEYIAGQQAVAREYNKRLADSIGGDENLKATFEWAAKSLPAEEIAEANVILKSGNEAQSKLLLQGLRARHEAVSGREPELLGGRSSSVTDGPKGYESTAQMVKDMNSVEYRTDPAFRDQVMARLKASKI